MKILSDAAVTKDHLTEIRAEVKSTSRRLWAAIAFLLIGQIATLAILITKHV